MALELTSDIIMNVMLAADPAQRQIAQSRLENMGEIGGPRFSDAMQETSDLAVNANSEMEFEQARLAPLEENRAESNVTDPYQGFEQIVLRNLFEVMLPKADSGAFGEGPSAGIWRSMTADQLATAYSSAGGVGIADMMQEEGKAISPQIEPAWPYFSLGSIKAFTG